MTLYDINATLVIPSKVCTLAKSDRVIEENGEIIIIESRLMINGVPHVYEDRSKSSRVSGKCAPGVKLRDEDYRTLSHEMTRLEAYAECKRLNGR